MCHNAIVFVLKLRVVMFLHVYRYYSTVTHTPGLRMSIRNFHRSCDLKA
jgi:hypothetical protein